MNQKRTQKNLKSELSYSKQWTCWKSNDIETTLNCFFLEIAFRIFHFAKTCFLLFLALNFFTSSFTLLQSLSWTKMNKKKSFFNEKVNSKIPCNWTKVHHLTSYNVSLLLISLLIWSISSFWVSRELVFSLKRFHSEVRQSLSMNNWGNIRLGTSLMFIESFCYYGYLKHKNTLFFVLLERRKKSPENDITMYIHW